MFKKIKYFLKENINFQFIVLSILVINLYFIDLISFFILLFIVLIYSSFIQIKKTTFAISFILTVILFALYKCINDCNKIMFTTWIDNIFNFSLRNYLIKYIDIKYTKEASSIVKMLLLSFKDDYSNGIYNQLSQLSVVHLLVVSGFHVNVYVMIIAFIFKKLKVVKIIITFVFLIIICYFNDFNLSIFRSLLFVIIKFFNRDRKNNNLLNLSIIVISLFVPLALNQYGFQMSCLSVLILFIYNNKYKQKSKIINFFLITLFINLALLPYTSRFNNKISMLIFFYNYIFTSWFSFLYLFVSIFFVFEFMNIPINNIISLFSEFIKIANSFNIFIYLNKFNEFASIAYITFILFSLNYGGLIKHEFNKIFFKKM